MTQPQTIEYETSQESGPEQTHTCLTAANLAYARKKGHLDATKEYAKRCPTGKCQTTIAKFTANKKNAAN